MGGILFFFGLLFILLFALSWKQVHSSGDSYGFIYRWAFWLGSFVWEDVLVFSAYHSLIVLFTYLSHDLRVGLLMIAVFWAVRSAGEALYFFLQQFHQPKHAPHHISDHLNQIRRFLGPIADQKAYIIMQIIHQSLTMLAITGAILLALYWHTLPSWF